MNGKQLSGSELQWALKGKRERRRSDLRKKVHDGANGAKQVAAAAAMAKQFKERGKCLRERGSNERRDSES